MSTVRLPARPSISVVMPVYNADRHLAEAVRSIQAQTYSRWELIVIDDGSTDASAALAAELAGADARIRLIRTAHGGAAQAVNAGAQLARGELLARMDADDVALPERFATQLAWMQSRRVDVCGSCVARFGELTGVIWFPETHAAISHEMLFRHGLLQPTTMMATEVFLAHRYDETARFEGNDLWLRLRRTLVLGNVPAVLLRHRCHARQTRVVRGHELSDSMATARRALFRELFPQAGAMDAEAIERVAARRGCATIADLERTGEWLARLAELPDAQLRRRMLARWRETCRRSTQLGPAAYGSYARWAAELGTGAAGPDRALRAACMTRLATDARVVQRVRGWRTTARMRAQ